MKTNDRQIAQNVITLRDHIGLSQQLMSERMKDRGHRWSQTTVARIESGERPLRLTEAADLSDVLACPIGYFTGEAPASDVTKGLAIAIDALIAYRRTFTAADVTDGGAES